MPTSTRRLALFYTGTRCDNVGEADAKYAPWRHTDERKRATSCDQCGNPEHIPFPLPPSPASPQTFAVS